MPTYLDRTSLTGLDPLSCRLVSAVRCRLVTRVTLRQLPSSSSFVQLSDWRSLPHFRSPEISSPKPFVWFRAKTDKGIVCLADHQHSVTPITFYLLFFIFLNFFSSVFQCIVEYNASSKFCTWKRSLIFLSCYKIRSRNRVWVIQNFREINAIMLQISKHTSKFK